MACQELVERVARLEERVNVILDNHIPHLEENIQWIRERLNRGYRPPWTVVALITFLTSLSVGLLIAFIKL